MRKLLVVFLAVVSALGLAGCGGGSSSKSKPTTTAARPGSGGNASSGATLSSYLKCLGQHGVNVKKAATAKGAGGPGAAIKKDPHYAAAVKACK